MTYTYTHILDDEGNALTIELSEEKYNEKVAKMKFLYDSLVESMRAYSKELEEKLGDFKNGIHYNKGK